jgi:hypothetical protein
MSGRILAWMIAASGWTVLPAGCGGSSSEPDGGDACETTATPRVTSDAAAFVEAGAASATVRLRFDLPVRLPEPPELRLEPVRGAGDPAAVAVAPGADAAEWILTFSTAAWRPFEAYALAVTATGEGECGSAMPEPFVLVVRPLPWMGETLDERSTRELAASYALPDAFLDALEAMGLAAYRLNFPDAGSTFATTPTRLHWIDAVRHDGARGAVFGAMVAEDVEAAAAATADRRTRELLLAQHVYLDRDAFTTLRFDRRYEVTDPARPLLDALRTFYEHAPVEGHPSPPTRPWSEIEPGLSARLASFSFEARAALALALRGLLDAADLRERALFASGAMSATLWETTHRHYVSGGSGFAVNRHVFGTDAYAAFDYEAMIRAGQLAVRSVESLRAVLADEVPADGARIDIVGPLGRLTVALDATDDVWPEADRFLLVDLAGDDVYEDGVAANRSFLVPVSVVLDVAGNDVYGPSVPWDIADGALPTSNACTQGAGLFGVAVLDDAAGNDDYHAAYASQGFGLFGVGVLVDHAGTDRYRGYSSSQGCGDFGYGLLADWGGGDDAYETLQKSQGYGGPRGIGWLVDDAGNDTYVAVSEPIVWDWAGEGTNWSGSQGFGYGVRDGFFTPGAPIFSGGLGGLFDLDGDDDYTCAVMCQGFGYAFGAGLFYDRRGDDDHLVTHKYAMGSATHWAIGLLLDGEGRDTYRNSGDDECIGLGYDASVAFHIDRGAEDDVYTIDHVGDFTLGAGRIPALGVLINEGGNDAYHVAGSGVRALGRSYTAADNRAGYLARVPNVGMFLDLGGVADVYDVARDGPANGGEWIQTDPDGDDWDPAHDFGYGLDTE